MPGEQSREAVKQKPAWKVIAFRKTQFTEELLASKAAPFRCLGAGRDAKGSIFASELFPHLLCEANGRSAGVSVSIDCLTDNTSLA